MGKSLSQLVVVDVEATCWDKNGPPKPKNEESEIIEIGLCFLDLHSFERRQKTSILIKPVRSTVSPFCTQLTTITQEMLDREGVTYEKAIERVNNEFHPGDLPWASWGAYDREMFETEARRRLQPGTEELTERRKAEPYRGMPHTLYPWSRMHTNMKHQMSLMLGRTNGEFGMAQACQQAGLRLEGTHHRGSDDSWNIAGIIAWLLKTSRAAFNPRS